MKSSYNANGKQPHVTRHDALKEAEASGSLRLRPAMATQSDPISRKGEKKNYTF